MVVKGAVRRGEYVDSVTLMRVAQRIRAEKGVIDSGLITATPGNKAILKASGLFVSGFSRANDTDLLVAVKARSPEIADRILGRIDGYLKENRSQADAGAAVRPASLEGALLALPGANLAMVSIAGRFAADEAAKALRQGLHVFLFSDNVPLAREVELKRLAGRQGLLLMGPDCGTAIVNGVPLGFANAVPRGAVGIVAASGTGLQEASSLVAAEGAGISQAIGTGGRDIKAAVGGATFLAALKALAADRQTEVVLLIAKPPHESVRRKIAGLLPSLGKPVVVVFLGGDAAPLRGRCVHGAATLEEGALMAAALACGSAVEGVRRRLAERDAGLKQRARSIVAGLGAGQKYVRALFSGGTFCSEAQAVFRGRADGLHSNVPLPGVARLPDSLRSRGHTFLDLGDDEFTAGRPHPMIDFSIRSQRMRQEAGDPQTALLLLDLVLGYGAHPDPLAEMVPAIRSCQFSAAQGKRSLPVLVSVTGTDQDPQGRRRVAAGLRGCGAEVLESSSAACELALFVAERLGGRA